MKVAILGLGYVGTTVALCLAEEGHTVHGFDISKSKVDKLNSAKLHIHEPKLKDFLSKYVQETFFAHDKLNESLSTCDFIVISVGTPTSPDGEVDLSQLRSVCEELHCLKADIKNIPIVLRSTVPPGTTQKLIVPIFSQNPVYYMPEFLREGSAVDDFYSSNCVIGSSEQSGGLDKLNVFPNFESKMIVNYKTAEFIKYVNNSFHALKVCFANEVGSIANKLDISNDELFSLFCSDTKLNISSKYLNPGFSYGGSCLTKDLSAINKMSSNTGVSSKMLASIESSNQDHTTRFLNLIDSLNPKNILFIGVAFKPDTDDQRSSQTITIIQKLLANPSYKKYERIDVMDIEIICNGLREKFNNQVNLYTEETVDLSIYDTVVWGSYNPKKLRVDFNKNIQFINLGYFTNKQLSLYTDNIFSVV